MLVVFNKRSHPKIVVPRPTIRQCHEGRQALLWSAFVLLLVAVGVLAWTAYEHGIERGGDKTQMMRREAAELQISLEALTQERDDLLQRVATLERSSQVDREASEQVRQMQVELQTERLELMEEVALLTRLLSDGESTSALRARRLVLESLDEQGAYRYRFALSKAPQTDEEVKVTLDIEVSGTREGEEKTFSLEELADGGAKTDFRFKQWVQVEGRLKLPDGFEPQTLKITAKPNKQEVLGIEREFPWKVD